MAMQESALSHCLKAAMMKVPIVVEIVAALELQRPSVKTKPQNEKVDDVRKQVANETMLGPPLLCLRSSQ